jgi:hypothetical protein
VISSTASNTGQKKADDRTKQENKAREQSSQENEERE